MKPLILLITILSIINWINGKILLQHNNWSKYLPRTLKNVIETNQILLFYDNDLNNNQIYQVGHKIARLLPIQIADFQSISNSPFLMIPLLPKTLVILIPQTNENLSTIFNMTKIVAKMSEPNTRPKLLIIRKTVIRTNYQKFLQKAWEKQFLDCTILEINENHVADEMNEFDFGKIHHYNPYRQRFSIKKFSKRSILFPDKLKDLHGHQIKTGMFHYPPYIYVERNATGQVLNVHGPDISWIRVLANVMNFTLEMIVSNVSNWDLVSCEKNKNVGISNMTINNEVQLINIQGAIYTTCFNNFVAISKGTKLIKFVILAPVFSRQHIIFQNELHLINIMSILSLFLIPLLIARFYNFDKQNWKTMYAIQMVLGFPTPKMPEKTIERILLLSMLFFYTLQSSYIFTTLSKIQMQKNSFEKMETFGDLLNANLTLIRNANTTEDGGLDDNDHYERVIKNSILSSDTVENWMEFLRVHKNFSYECREDLVLLNLKKMKNNDGQLVMDIMKEISGQWPSGFYLAEGSPYKNRISRFMTVFSQIGLNHKWNNLYIPKSVLQHEYADLFHQETSLTYKVQRLMIITLLFGYFSSLAVFAAEISVHKMINKMH